MTYQVLARKWRPKSFASLVGQEHVVRALTHALDGGRLHHAYLFTGTRGVGKTTLSRIFAKALNCETGVTSTPCGVCRACKEIDEGRLVAYVAMDAVSNRGVEQRAVLGMFGSLDKSYLIRLFDTLAAGDGQGVLGIADEMALRSLSFSTALQNLAGLLHGIAWAQFARLSVLDEWPEAADIRRFADLLSAEHVQLFYQIVTIGRGEMGLAPDEYAGFTMTLLRMLAFEPAGGPGGGDGGGARGRPAG